jgi:multiple sugar transport system substrate-binding protein
MRRSVPILVLPLLLVPACGGVGDDAGVDEGAAGTVDGRITTMGFGGEDEIGQARLRSVEDAYPDLEVDVNSGAFEEQQFLNAVSSGKPPSLIYLPRSELGTYAARGALAPLTDCLDEQGVDLDQYRDAAVQQVTYDGDVYGIPEFNSVRILLVNTEALRKAGLAPEDVASTDWDRLEQSTRQLADADGGEIRRIGFDPKIPEFLPLWTAALGGELVSEDGLTAHLDSPEAVQALEYTVGLVEDQGGWSRFKAFRDTWDFFGGDNQLVADQVGAFPMDDWYLDVLADVSPDAPVEAMPFTDTDGEPLTYATGNAWAIPAGAPNTDAACAFAAHMTSVDTWITAAEASKAEREKAGGEYLGTWTANEEADTRIFEEVYEPTGNEALDTAVEVVRSVQSVAVVDPPSPAAAEVKRAWEDAALRVLQGEQTAAEALAQAQEEAQEAIDGAAS